MYQMMFLIQILNMGGDNKKTKRRGGLLDRSDKWNNIHRFEKLIYCG